MQVRDTPSWVNLPIERNNGGDWWWRVCLNGVDLNTSPVATTRS
ncbi:MAG: hypothetical protein WKF83_04700 [Nocardioidaceae bacterium]